MAEQDYAEGWHEARLIPAIGIRGQEEQEKRATSSLLAVMRAVPEFGYSLVGPLGAPKGRIATFTEVQVKDAAGNTNIPDGAIIVERGKTSWDCLVEVKTGSAQLQAEQVNRYLDWERENTASPESGAPGHAPTSPAGPASSASRIASRRSAAGSALTARGTSARCSRPSCRSSSSRAPAPPTAPRWAVRERHPVPQSRRLAW